MTEARTYPAGVTSWTDVEVSDVEAAKEFYGGLFGWTFADATPPGAPSRYVIARLDGEDAAGIAGPTEPGSGRTSDASWNTYVATDDARATVGRVEAAGGRVLSPPTAAGEGGIAAVCTDVAGVEFRVWQARRRLGAQITNAPGAWNFSDLHAADPAASRAFYADVFGWEFTDLGLATMIGRPGYGDHLASTIDPGIHDRQAAVDAPPGFADAIAWLAAAEAGEAPHWHVTFTVVDRDQAVAAAERLGGTVLTTSDTEWTKAATIRDPQGAAFTASQFTPPGTDS
ncbi:VOC family protein [Solicola gregarius]|uniref:VOC family protein n=1 Tax=Solicola gregarius TaxID=2908642 RepID=A0AA46YL61_9ACTN|nr:VOC family protein [Solicola gregarius]UYM06237.1 VOC family protein [Solicola gregarius]